MHLQGCVPPSEAATHAPAGMHPSRMRGPGPRMVWSAPPAKGFADVWQGVLHSCVGSDPLRVLRRPPRALALVGEGADPAPMGYAGRRADPPLGPVDARRRLLEALSTDAGAGEGRRQSRGHDGPLARYLDERDESERGRPHGDRRLLARRRRKDARRRNGHAAGGDHAARREDDAARRTARVDLVRFSGRSRSSP